ncbi:hypothetical protein V8F06_002224 [Rhypophila decipiens]
MAPNDFVVLNEGGRPPTPNRNRGIPPPPPNHGRPPQGGGIPPRVINAAPHPADMQHVQRQAPPMHMPAQHQPPLVLQHNPPVRISDIRKERLTPDEAREELSDYIIYRFEPSQRLSDGYDDDNDDDRRPNWESCFVLEVRGVSKKEAARQVRRLNQTTWSLGDKKSTLSGAQQRQIEKILEELQAHDHPFFQTNLVQINHQLRTTKTKTKHDKHHKHSTKNITLFRDPKHHKRSSSSKEKKKPKHQERISLTAYYKRSPKPEMDALAIYHQREAHFRRFLQPQPPPPMAPPPEAGHHHQHHHGAEGGQARIGGGGGGGGGGNGGGGGGWNGNKGHGGGKNGGPVAQVVHPNDRKGGGRRDSRSPPGSSCSGSSNSDKTLFSETFSIDDDMSTITSSSGGSFHGPRRQGSFHRQHPRKDRQYRLEGPADYGLRQSNGPHRGQGREVHRISDEFHAPMMPPPLPRLVQPVVDIERIKSSAYEAGLADARADVEVIADRIAMATVSAVQQPPLRPPPSRLQRRPSIRLVAAGNVSREEATLEELERMDLRDQALEEARYTLAAGSNRRRNGRREDVWEEDHRAPRRRPLDEAMDYIRRTDADAHIPFMENPFAPEERRRTSPGDPYYTDFRRRDGF